jgi:mRNA interferase RelE/StbE
MLEIRYSDQAVKFLRKVNKDAALRIRAKIRQYAENPSVLKNQVKKLTNSLYYRLRVGNYRVIFTETGEIMKIEKIGNRGDVYRGV